jgi:hypothetical protein
MPIKSLKKSAPLDLDSALKSLLTDFYGYLVRQNWQKKLLPKLPEDTPAQYQREIHYEEGIHLSGYRMGLQKALVNRIERELSLTIIPPLFAACSLCFESHPFSKETDYCDATLLFNPKYIIDFVHSISLTRNKATASPAVVPTTSSASTALSAVPPETSDDDLVCVDVPPDGNCGYSAIAVAILAAHVMGVLTDEQYGTLGLKQILCLAETASPRDVRDKLSVIAEKYKKKDGVGIAILARELRTFAVREFQRSPEYADFHISSDTHTLSPQDRSTDPSVAGGDGVYISGEYIGVLANKLELRIEVTSAGQAVVTYNELNLRLPKLSLQLSWQHYNARISRAAVSRLLPEDNLANPQYQTFVASLNNRIKQLIALLPTLGIPIGVVEQINRLLESMVTLKMYISADSTVRNLMARVSQMLSKGSSTTSTLTLANLQDELQKYEAFKNNFPRFESRPCANYDEVLSATELLGKSLPEWINQDLASFATQEKELRQALTNYGVILIAPAYTDNVATHLKVVVNCTSLHRALSTHELGPEHNPFNEMSQALADNLNSWFKTLGVQLEPQNNTDTRNNLSQMQTTPLDIRENCASLIQAYNILLSSLSSLLYKATNHRMLEENIRAELLNQNILNIVLSVKHPGHARIIFRGNILHCLICNYLNKSPTETQSLLNNLISSYLNGNVNSAGNDVQTVRRLGIFSAPSGSGTILVVNDSRSLYDVPPGQDCTIAETDLEF